MTICDAGKKEEKHWLDSFFQARKHSNVRERVPVWKVPRAATLGHNDRQESYEPVILQTYSMAENAM